MDREALEELKTLQVKARKLLGEACSRGNLRMCIPARPAEDDDLVIASALDSIPTLIAEVERLTAPSRVVQLLESERNGLLGLVSDGRIVAMQDTSLGFMWVPWDDGELPPALQSGGSNEE